MTRTKAWRLSLAAILGFGWLFITPAYSDDPLSLAAQEIQKLNQNVSELSYKDQFVSLIDVAEQKYDDAVAAKNTRDNAFASYDTAVATEATALQEKNAAQADVNNQSQIVSNALLDKNAAQDALDIANINLSNTQAPSVGYQGVSFQIYPLDRKSTRLNSSH